MRRLALLVAALLVALVGGPPAQAGPAFPDVIPMPPEHNYPEGIEAGRGTTVYVGSIHDGALYRGDVRTGEGSVISAGVAGRVLAGLAYDRRGGILWGAGSDGGDQVVFGFDGDTGALLHTVPVPQAGFLNDLVVTRTALHVTDTVAPVLWTLPLTNGGAPAGPPLAVPLGGDFTYVTEGDPFPANLNGIAATPDGRTLVAVHTLLGVLYRIDPVTGHATEIDLGGETVVFGDGITLAGRTLYVVRNFPEILTVVSLDPGFASGKVVEEVTSPLFRVPATSTVVGSHVYLINARFDDGFPPSFGGEPQDLDYEIVRVPR